MTPTRASLALLLVLTQVGGAAAQDAESCRTIRLSAPGWTDIDATNAVASVLLEALGYDVEINTLSVPVGYEAMKNGDIDVFLGNWMPAQQSFRDDLEAAGAVEVLAQNLTGAKFTLAVPRYVAEQGVTDFGDLAEHASEFDNEIYGIEPGAPANQNIQRMIASGDFGLGDWEVVDSGEQAMLAQVGRAERGEDWIVFLAWAPHPMNAAHDITYLSGGDAYFGPNFGGADVFTLARTGWSGECPNAAQFFENLVFGIDAPHPRRGDGTRRGGRKLDVGEPGKAAALARRREHCRPRVGTSGGPERPRPLTPGLPVPSKAIIATVTSSASVAPCKSGMRAARGLL